MPDDRLAFLPACLTGRGYLHSDSPKKLSVVFATCGSLVHGLISFGEAVWQPGSKVERKMFRTE